jgi:type IV secretory pathway VirB2 component (pilin)
MDISDVVITGGLLSISLLLSIPLGIMVAYRSHDISQSDGIILGFLFWIFSIALGGFASITIFYTLNEVGF